MGSPEAMGVPCGTGCEAAPSAADASSQRRIPNAESFTVTFDEERSKYVRSLRDGLNAALVRADKAERQVRDLARANEQLRKELIAETPLVEFFRDEGFDAYGREGDYNGWSPEQTAVHFLREHMRCSVLEGGAK